MTYAGKGSYYGYWSEGQRQGEGVFIYPNEDVYSGSWSAGFKEGVGTFIFKETGIKLQGEWKKGTFARGKWIYPNGTYYEGSYDSNKPKGIGKWCFSNGNVMDGEYAQITKVSTDPAVEDEMKLLWTTTSSVYEAAR